MANKTFTAIPPATALDVDYIKFIPMGGGKVMGEIWASSKDSVTGQAVESGVSRSAPFDPTGVLLSTAANTLIGIWKSDRGY